MSKRHSAAGLPGGPFRVADARASGFSVRQLRGDRLWIPTPGVRSAAELTAVRERATAFALVLPDDVVFSHTTAAQLWGLALPPRLERVSQLEVTRRTGKARIVRTGVTCHRGLERRVVETAHGVRVTSVADTWCDLIETYRRSLSLSDAVMIGDAAVERIHRTRPWVDEGGRLVFDVDEVHPQASPGTSAWWSEPVNAGIWQLVKRRIEHGRAPGRDLTHAALKLIRPRVWSPMESRSRLVLVEGGIREPRLNASVLDVAGRILSIGDHVWEEEQSVANYNGRLAHEGEGPRERDNGQRLRLEDQGWWFLEMYRDDIMTSVGRRDLIRRVSAGLARERRRPG